MEEETDEGDVNFFKITDLVETQEIYDSGAHTYDAIVESENYVGASYLVYYLMKLPIRNDGIILDIGAGTGGVGEVLRQMGYDNLHALDGSRAMLDIARQKGRYKTYTHLLVESSTILPFATGYFDCVVLAGVFAPGHLPINALHEIRRVTRRGGIVAWIQCNPLYYKRKNPQYNHLGYQELVHEMEARRQWTCIPGFPIFEDYSNHTKGYIQAYEVK